MKKTGLVLGLFLGSFLLPFTSFANENTKSMQNSEITTVTEDSVRLPKGIFKSIDYDKETKGSYISASMLSLTNEGYGVLGVTATTTAHVDVAKIRMNIYLDQWNEEKQNWEQISLKQLIYEDKTGDEKLSDVTESFTIEGCKPGYYYRLRATHAVWSFSGATEVHATRTEGVLLTEGPL